MKGICYTTGQSFDIHAEWSCIFQSVSRPYHASLSHTLYQ